MVETRYRGALVRVNANTDGMRGEHRGEGGGERGRKKNKTGIKIDFSIMLAVSRGRHMF